MVASDHYLFLLSQYITVSYVRHIILLFLFVSHGFLICEMVINSEPTYVAFEI